MATVGAQKLQKIPLLSQSNIPRYCTIGSENTTLPKPKLSIVIPANKRPIPVLVSGDYRDVAVDIDRLSQLDSASSCGYCMTATTEGANNNCEFCREHNLTHDLNAQLEGGFKVNPAGSSLWRRISENGTTLTVLEFLISVQMRLLSLLVPILLVLIVLQYVMTR